jgi:hypothetical protein
MDNQPSRSTSKGLTRGLIIPFATPLINGAGKVGEVAQAGVLQGVKMFGTDGGGGRISKYYGIAAEYAAKARIGGGTLKNNGLGIAGGEARLAMVGTVVAGVLVVGVVGTALYADLVLAKEAKQADQTPAAGTCDNCQGDLTVVPVDGESDAAAVCPQCGHGGAGGA